MTGLVKIKSYDELVELTDWVGLYRGYADNIYVEKKTLRMIADKEMLIKARHSNCLTIIDPNDEYCETIMIPSSFVLSFITRNIIETDEPISDKRISVDDLYGKK